MMCSLPLSVLGKGGLQFKYYAAGEYGGETFRPHVHVCLFYAGDLGFVEDKSVGNNNGYVPWWSHGFVNRGEFNAQTARYTADYLLKSLGDEVPAFVPPPFRLVSSGLAGQYIKDNARAFSGGAIRYQRSFVSVPRAYRKYMVRWLDDRGVPENNNRLVASLYGARLMERTFARSEQRESNISVRQKMYKKDF